MNYLYALGVQLVILKLQNRSKVTHNSVQLIRLKKKLPNSCHMINVTHKQKETVVLQDKIHMSKENSFFLEKDFFSKILTTLLTTYRELTNVNEFIMPFERFIVLLSMLLLPSKHLYSIITILTVNTYKITVFDNIKSSKLWQFQLDPCKLPKSIVYG